MWKALRSKNTCKTCAVGMGGQSGGMVNETGRSLEMCKKSVQAMAADLQEAGACEHLESHAIAQLKKQTPYQLEHAGRLTHPMLYEKGRDSNGRKLWGVLARHLKRPPPMIPFGTSVVEAVTKLVFYFSYLLAFMVRTMSTIAVTTVIRPVESG